MEVQLVIKAPNQNVEDFLIDDCDVDWTVEELKIYLSASYPDNPMVEDQKLIYSGRLLTDDLHLRDVLRKEEGQPSIHTLHLVCKGLPPNHSQNLYSSQNLQNTSAPQLAVRNAPNTVHSSEDLRQRNIAIPLINPDVPQISQGVIQQPSFPVFVPDSQVAAQIAAMQQTYAYYLAQYLQSVNPPGVGTNISFPHLSPNQNPPVDVPAQAPGAPALNVQGGQVLEEEEVNRDWLDQLFILGRFVILFFILYFYSTPERLMIVVICASVALLYQEGWFARRRPRAALVEEQAPQENPNDPSSRANIENDQYQNPMEGDLLQEMQGEHELEAAMDGDNPPHVLQAADINDSHIFSPLAFVTTFFSSLIPDAPPNINPN